MATYQILCLVGVPSISVAIITYCVAHLQKMKKKQDALELGVQALLRSQLIDSYNKYKKKGSAPIYVKDNFDNLYQQYEALGENGVMTKIYNEFMDFRTEGDNNV